MKHQLITKMPLYKPRKNGYEGFMDRYLWKRQRQATRSAIKHFINGNTENVNIQKVISIEVGI